MKEKLAELCHEQWSNWMKYLFEIGIEETTVFDSLMKKIEIKTGTIIIPSWVVERWKRQMNTPYNDLSEEEKESDRKEADKFLEKINKEK